MSAVDELCAFGFEKFWVNQALELTNHDKECALEWLLSDEFQLAQQQYNAEQAAQNKKHSKQASSSKQKRQQEIEIEVDANDYEHKHNNNKEMEIEIEYDLNKLNNDESSGLSVEYSNPSLKYINSDKIANTSAPFSKLSTTIVHDKSDSDNDDSDDMLNMEYLDEMSMGNQSMDMSSMNNSSMSFAMADYNLPEIMDGDWIDNADALIFRDLLHLRHTYSITPLFHNNDSFIVSTKTFNRKNDLPPGVFLYQINTNQWEQIAQYPEMFNFQSHQHVLDNDNNMLYIYNNNFEDGLFIIYDIMNNKFRGIKRNIYNRNRNYNNYMPRMYQSICSIYVSSPIHELHFIANTNTNSNHFRYDTLNNKITKIEMIGLENKNYVMNPKVIYVANLQRLYSFGGYNGSLHRDVSFLQYNNILYCDILGNLENGQKQLEYTWVNSKNKLPFKSSIFDVILCFDTILIFFYGKIIHLFDLNLHMDDKKWYKCEKVYPLNECYDLQIIYDNINRNIHFIHCTNPLGLSLMPQMGNHFREHSVSVDKPYHIKISVFDIIPKQLFDKYQIKFPLCLSGIIRHLLNKFRLNTKFNDIPKDIFNIILGYFHPLCLAKRK